VLALIGGDPSLGRPLAGADDYLRAEIYYAASHEGARHLDDVLARRTHIAIETPDRGLEAVTEAAELVAGALRWDSGQMAREVEHYRAEVAAQRASEEAGSDADAESIAGAVADIVPVRTGADAGHR
jgi:glycerol-3-phosphate dehydrogenase